MSCLVSDKRQVIRCLCRRYPTAIFSLKLPALQNDASVFNENKNLGKQKYDHLTNFKMANRSRAKVSSNETRSHFEVKELKAKEARDGRGLIWIGL